MMREREPSRTALGAAAHRALHQALEGGRVFADPIAGRILGDEAAAQARRDADRVANRGMRLCIAARSAVAEGALAAGVEARGVRQLVVLGAGLDTFAYRNPHGERLRVFEVDHPATQAWKRRRLRDAGIAVPPSLTFAAVDFERQDLLAVLQACGLRTDQRTFFTWLGVVPYLTRAAIFATLGLIGALPGGGEVVFDYSDPPDLLPEAARSRQAERAGRVAALGEPWLSYFDPAELHRELARLGFTHIDDLGPPALIRRHILPEGAPAPADLPERGGHVLFAATG